MTTNKTAIRNLVTRAARRTRRFVIFLLSAGLLVGCTPAALLNLQSGGLPEGTDRGVSYGTHARHAYDVYRPKEVNADTPVVVFFYGGSWDGGSRSGYAFVGNALAALGYVGVVADYRVYPDVVFPGFVSDAAAAVKHVVDGVGSGRRLFVMGHSAGAHIASLVAFDSSYLAKHGLDTCDAIAGFIGLAGPYDFLPLRQQRYRNIFPESERPVSQPVNHVGPDSAPTLLVHGLGDRLVVPGNSRSLAQRLEQNAVPTTLKLLEGVGHVRPVIALADALDFVAPVREAIQEFVSAQSIDTRRRCG